LKAEQKGHLLELVTDAPQRANNLLKRALDRWRVSLFGARLHVIVDEDATTGIQNITEKLSREGIQVSRAREQSYSLEDVFIAVVEKLRKEGKSAEE
jgi:ABC-2 type transport system ATP-binding protein